MIPCIFWLVQKATLLKETPVHDSNGELNMERVKAANNIFAAMMTMQKMRYPPLRENEQVLWYLMRLEREGKEGTLDEDEMYRLSDAAKAQAGRSRSTSFTLRPSFMKKAGETGRRISTAAQSSIPALNLGTEGADPNAVSLQDVLTMAERTLESKSASHSRKNSESEEDILLRPPKSASRSGKTSPRFGKKK